MGLYLFKLSLQLDSWKMLPYWHHVKSSVKDFLSNGRMRLCLSFLASHFLPTLYHLHSSDVSVLQISWGESYLSTCFSMPFCSCSVVAFGLIVWVLWFFVWYSYWYNFDSNYWSAVYKRTYGKDFKFKAGYDSEVGLGWASLWVSAAIPLTLLFVCIKARSRLFSYLPYLFYHHSFIY